MNRFRKLGFIEYNGRIRVHKSLLKVILHDRMPDDNAFRPGVPDAPRTRSSSVKRNVNETFNIDQHWK